MVLAANEENGEVAYKEVVRTFVNTTDEITHVTIQNDEGEQEIIDSTPQHPFYVEGMGWVEASSLHAGMTIWFANGTKGTVADISNEGLEEPVTVYNFEVEDFHTYYVGASCVLVHNMCAKNPNHGNSLSTTKPAEGYILRENGTHRIMKYGETTRGLRRYTNKFYVKNNVYMDTVMSGTKREMHAWQHKMIENYAYIVGELPPLNKSFY